MVTPVTIPKSTRLIRENRSDNSHLADDHLLDTLHPPAFDLRCLLLVDGLADELGKVRFFTLLHQEVVKAAVAKYV